jgi:hypothetical protein
MASATRHDLIQRARRVLRSLERAQLARSRLPASRLDTGFAGEPELASVYGAVHSGLLALQREARVGTAGRASGDMARLLARLERDLPV